MKKLLLSILALLYLASTTGAMLETHFCMGELAEWSIGDSTGDDCGLCGMPKNEDQDNGCCSDEESFFKITDDQKTPGGITAPYSSPERCPPVRFTCHPIEQRQTPVKPTLVHAPPGSPGIARHVLISVFRI